MFFIIWFICLCVILKCIKGLYPYITYSGFIDMPSKIQQKYVIPLLLFLTIFIISSGIHTSLTQPVFEPQSATYELIETDEIDAKYIIESKDKYVFYFEKNSNVQLVYADKKNVKINYVDNSNKVIETISYSTNDLNDFWQTLLAFDVKFGDYGLLHKTTINKNYEVFIPKGTIIKE